MFRLKLSDTSFTRPPIASTGSVGAARVFAATNGVGCGVGVGVGLAGAARAVASVVDTPVSTAACAVARVLDARVCIATRVGAARVVVAGVVRVARVIFTRVVAAAAGNPTAYPAVGALDITC